MLGFWFPSFQKLRNQRKPLKTWNLFFHLTDVDAKSDAPDASNMTDSDLDIEVTAWMGGVNNHLLVSQPDDSDSNFNDTEWESDSSGDDVDELEGEELVESLRKEIEHEMHLLQELELTPYKKISSVKITAKEWK